MRIQVARIFRFLLGLVFIFSGFVKAVDPWGSQFKLEDYFIAFGWDWAIPFALVGGIVLSAIEFLIGICFVFGLKPRLSLLGAIVLMVIFLPLTLYLAITNAVSDCGCFGDAIKLSNWGTFIKNIVFTIMLIPIYLERRKLKSRVRLLNEWLIIGVFSIFILGISIYGLRHLPIIDFLPYKEGLSMKPDSTQKDKYFVVYRNKKTGQLEEYPANNFPWNDSIWMKEHEFVSQRVEKASTPYLINVFDAEDNDVTNQTILFPNYQLIVVSYNLKKVQPKAIEKVRSIIEQANEKGISACILTATDKNEAEALRHEYQWAAPVYFADDIILKMFVRNNPGVVLMHDGTILKKWAWRDVPDLSSLNLEKLRQKYMQKK
jgi:uncharacterized membrane protein YphA (DoxX/SURF4 family)